MKNCIHIVTMFYLFIHSHNIVAFEKCPHKILANEGTVSQNEIIDLHNQYRQMAINGSIKGQPRASSVSMNLLKWDRQLEHLALEVSKTCNLKHIDVITREFPDGLGQNLYRSCSNKRRKINWNKVVADWYNEHKVYKFLDKPSILNGHYTQVIWGRSRLIGCAYSEYFQETRRKIPYCVLYVCHYAPRGNIVGEVPYKAAG